MTSATLGVSTMGAMSSLITFFSLLFLSVFISGSSANKVMGSTMGAMISVFVSGLIVMVFFSLLFLSVFVSGSPANKVMSSAGATNIDFSSNLLRVEDPILNARLPLALVINCCEISSFTST